MRLGILCSHNLELIEEYDIKVEVSGSVPNGFLVRERCVPIVYKSVASKDLKLVIGDD